MNSEIDKVQLVCGQQCDYDPLLHCPICGKGESSKRKLTSTENGQTKIRNVSITCDGKSM